MLASKVLDTSERLLVVSGDAAERATLSQALWDRHDAFLAHGEEGDPHAARQPILVASDCAAANSARCVLIADGIWRAEAAAFDRALLLFGREQTGEARELWIALGSQGHALRIFKQRDDGSWREGR